MAFAAPTAHTRVLADVFTKTWVSQALLIVGAAVFVGISAQIAIPLPFTPVPLTGQTFAVLLSAAALGSLRGVAAMVLYAVAGVAGVPWFAQGSHGFALASFGYILGFIAAAWIVGAIAERGATRTPLKMAGLMVIGNVVIYAFGVTWLAFAVHVDFAKAISLGLTPFIIGDLIKIALAAGLVPLAWKGLERLNLKG